MGAARAAPQARLALRMALIVSLGPVWAPDPPRPGGPSESEQLGPWLQADTRQGERQLSDGCSGRLLGSTRGALDVGVPKF